MKKICKEIIGALIGDNLNHSYSKIIHEKIGSKYDLINLSKEELSTFLSDWKIGKIDLDFVNVTIPYKVEVLKYLDEVTDLVELIGSCNLIVRENNKLIGFNTDYFGFDRQLLDNSISFKDKEILILGSGGASKMVYQYAIYNHCKQVYVASRTKKDSRIINYLDYENIYNYNYDIICNCTPVGMNSRVNGSLIDFNRFNELPNVVIDLIYNPNYTKLLIDAKLNNINVLNGLMMLIYQAFHVYNILNINVDIRICEKIYKDLMSTTNIILSGMSGVGKSTIAKKLSSTLNKKYVDTDSLIVAKYGSINDIFKNNGEEYFRKLEKNVVDEITNDNNQIISLGGGTILDIDNYYKLKANGIIIYLYRDLNDILIDEEHPLVKTKEEQINLFNNRIKTYEKFNDYKIDVSDIDEAIEKIKKIIIF